MIMKKNEKRSKAVENVIHTTSKKEKGSRYLRTRLRLELPQAIH